MPSKVAGENDVEEAAANVPSNEKDVPPTFGGVVVSLRPMPPKTAPLPGVASKKEDGAVAGISGVERDREAKGSDAPNGSEEAEEKPNSTEAEEVKAAPACPLPSVDSGGDGSVAAASPPTPADTAPLPRERELLLGGARPSANDCSGDQV